MKILIQSLLIDILWFTLLFTGSQPLWFYFITGVLFLIQIVYITVNLVKKHKSANQYKN
jgi:hypothetical protein